MQIIHAQNVYSYVLTEDEWYSGTDQQREAWQVEVRRKAEDLGCRYMTIMVEPDALFSVSPIARRHAVWRYATPTSAEEDFRNSLIAVLDLHINGLTAERMRALAKEVFG